MQRRIPFFLVPLRKARKGASFAEYALLLTLLGSTSAFMVLQFSLSFIHLFEQSTALQKNAHIYAQTAQNDRLVLADGTLPAGNVGSPYTADITPFLTETGFLAQMAPPVWTVGGMPTGLVLDPQTGTIGGTPTAAGSFTITASVEREGAKAQRTYIIAIAP